MFYMGKGDEQAQMNKGTEAQRSETWRWQVGDLPQASTKAQRSETWRRQVGDLPPSSGKRQRLKDTRFRVKNYPSGEFR